ncbi:hypothetical protein [Bradyrhizobium sp. 187]|uniref:hypothetical protein n=1 Tax=Bradyrhizobium sp. 187 TaxID=2782655 RepID=UPI0020003DE1|nr:hypothetical protein [Bradyrhizobium sp. 187]
MTALLSYSIGTVSVAADGTTVTGSGVIWSGSNVKPGDRLDIGHFSALIVDVVDPTHLTITPWPGSTVSGASYVIWQDYPQRVTGIVTMQSVNKLVDALNTSGFFVFVDIADTEPDPSLGDDGQYALQPTTGKQWVKSGGIWVYQGIYKAFQIKGAWSGATAYAVNDVVALSGSSYACVLDHTNHTPPNTSYWQLLASIGSTGATGPTGAGYGGTSTTSLAITVASKVFTTQAGLAYTNGARVRATATAGATGWLEGVATYSGTTLTITSDKISGSGTGTAWNLNVVGEPGAGDLTSANNLSDVASAASAATNLGVVRYGGSQSLTDAQQSQVQANIGGSRKNYLLNPSGEIDQEGVSAGVSRSDVAYDFDQWLTLTQSAAVTVSAIANAEDGTPFMMRTLQANATAQRFGRIQWIESGFCRDLRAQSVVLSARAKMSAAATLRYALVEWTGTADAITKDIVSDWTSATFTAGNFFTSTSTTVVAAGSIAMSANTLTDIAAITGTVSGSMNNLSVIFWTDSTQAQNVTLDIGKVKVEKGTIPSKFTPPVRSTELQALKRYWQPIRIGFQFAAVTTGGAYGNVQTWPCEMRATPTVAQISNIGVDHFPTTAPTTSGLTTIGGLFYKTASASGNGFYDDLLSLNARL